MADTNLYKILSGLYTGLNKLNTKSDRRDNEIITGYLGYPSGVPATSGTVDARLKLLEAGTSAASGVLTIAGKEYSPLSSVEVLSSDIIANVSAALATGATGLAVAGDVYANDMFLSGKIDDIASSFLTGAVDDNNSLNVLHLTTDGHDVKGEVLVDGSTILNSTGKVLKSGLKLVKKGEVADSNNAAEYFLADATGKAIEGSAEINIVKDQFLSGAAYDAATEELVLTFTVPSGSLVTRIDVKDMVHEYQGSGAIDVANTIDGKSAISLKLAPSGTNDNKYLNITSAGLGLSGITEAIAAVSTNSTTGLETLSAAVSGYLSGNAVSNKFADIDTHLTAIDTKLGTDVGNSASSGQVFVADASGNLDASGKTIGGATLDTTPSADKLATEAAVKDALDGLNDNLKGAYADNKVVLGNGGTGLKASAYEIGGNVALEAKPSADKLATEEALWAQYDKTVNTDLDDLATNVAKLANEI